jgi:type I restriction-modification system DNA methylase subunit
MDFQTPTHIAKFMVGMIPIGARTILEPTPGEGNILKLLQQHKEYHITAPDNFFTLPAHFYDCVIMNPPFSDKQAYGIPEAFEIKGMKTGYYFLKECMNRSDHVIALMPIFTITDSDVRNRIFKSYGVKSITLLPRRTFEYSRIQTCILELHKGWPHPTTFSFYDESKLPEIENIFTTIEKWRSKAASYKIF